MPTTFDVVKKVISEVIECDELVVKIDSKIIYDLGADSLDIVDLNYSLGKALQIKMPTKTVIVHAMEICGNEELLVENDCLTKIGAELLKQCPNKYTNEQVIAGTPLIDVFENTQVHNWVNLCDAILKSENRNGDTVIKENATGFLSNVHPKMAQLDQDQGKRKRIPQTCI